MPPGSAAADASISAEIGGGDATLLLLYEQMWKIHETRYSDRASAWRAVQRLMCPRVLFEKQGDAWIEVEIPSFFRETFANEALMRLRTHAAGIIQAHAWQRKTLSAIEDQDPSGQGFAAASPRRPTSILDRVVRARSGSSVADNAGQSLGEDTSTTARV